MEYSKLEDINGFEYLKEIPHRLKPGYDMIICIKDGKLAACRSIDAGGEHDFFSTYEYPFTFQDITHMILQRLNETSFLRSESQASHIEP